MIILILVLIYPNSVLALLGKKNIDIVEWKCPVPRFTDMNLKLNNVVELIGDGQLILLLPPTKMDLWTQGTVKSYEDVRYSSAMAVINQPVDVVGRRILSIDGALKALPQLKKIEPIAMNDHHLMVKFYQEYDLGAFALKSLFYWQYTADANGDLCALLHKGDVDAGVSRMEFIPVSENQTLLVMTHWQDLSTASFFYRLMINSNPETKFTLLPIAASAVVQSFKELFSTESEKEHVKPLYKGKQDIPLFSTKPELKDTLYKLAQIGTPTFLHPPQKYDDHGIEKNLQFATGVQVYPASFSTAKPYIWDIKSMPEYFTQFDEVKEKIREDNDKEIFIKAKYGVGLMKLTLNLSFDYVVNNDHVVYFQNPKGDVLVLGAEELVEVESESNGPNTIQIYTAGSLIGEDAPWLVKYLERSLPQVDLMRNVGLALMRVEQQLPWMIEKLNEEKVLISKGN